MGMHLIAVDRLGWGLGSWFQDGLDWVDGSECPLARDLFWGFLFH
jgi:hypothetical protein